MATDCLLQQITSKQVGSLITISEQEVNHGAVSKDKHK